MMRVLVILAVLWQPLILAASGPRPGTSVPGGQPTCSLPVVQAYCCKTKTRAPSCHAVVTDCGCAIRPTEQPERVPVAPLPGSDRDSLVAVQICGPPLREQIEPSTRFNLFSTQSDRRYANKSHNEIQAILGIWRT